MRMVDEGDMIIIKRAVIAINAREGGGGENNCKRDYSEKTKVKPSQIKSFSDADTDASDKTGRTLGKECVG